MSMAGISQQTLATPRLIHYLMNQLDPETQRETQHNLERKLQGVLSYYVVAKSI